MKKTSPASPSLADRIYDRLLADIIKGNHDIHARLPAEAQLSADLGVSRPVLRTALARLRDDGIITSQRGSGNFVARRPEPSVMDFVPLGSITDIKHCFEFRIDVESAAARWAAERRTDRDLRGLETAFERMNATYRQQELGVEADRALHLGVATASQNPYFVSVLQSLSRQMQFGMKLARSLTLKAPPERNAVVQTEHRRIIDAIADRDDTAAATAMRDHIRNAWDRMFVGS